MSEAGREHRLEGLEPDNLLAFLTLLGLLRSIEHARPAWRPRVRWSLDEPPQRPMLLLRELATAEAIASAAAEAVADLSKAHTFDRKLLSFTPAEARERLRLARTEKSCEDLWSALVSDAAVDDTKGLVRKTALNFLDVAQVAFLKSLSTVATKAVSPKRGPAQCIADACFAPWRRPDDTLAFRWDPIEDSRHAYRANAPTGDRQKVEHGANLLASIGLRSFTAVPAQSGTSVQLLARGVRVTNGVTFRWPVWKPPLSLAAIEALLGDPDLAGGRGERLGAPFVVEAARLNAPGSKYRNVSRARIIITG